MHPLCKILNTPVMSICLVKQNDGTWVEKHQRLYSTFSNVFFFNFRHVFVHLLTFFIFFSGTFFFTSIGSSARQHRRFVSVKCTVLPSPRQRLFLDHIKTRFYGMPAAPGGRFTSFEENTIYLYACLLAEKPRNVDLLQLRVEPALLNLKPSVRVRRTRSLVEHWWRPTFLTESVGSILIADDTETLTIAPVVKVVLWNRGGGSSDEARLEQTSYPSQPH